MRVFDVDSIYFDDDWKITGRAGADVPGYPYVPWGQRNVYDQHVPLFLQFPVAGFAGGAPAGVEAVLARAGDDALNEVPNDPFGPRPTTAQRAAAVAASMGQRRRRRRRWTTPDPRDSVPPVVSGTSAFPTNTAIPSDQQSEQSMDLSSIPAIINSAASAYMQIRGSRGQPQLPLQHMAASPAPGGGPLDIPGVEVVAGSYPPGWVYDPNAACGAGAWKRRRRRRRRDLFTERDMAQLQRLAAMAGKGEVFKAAVLKAMR